jgi:hypothetical protein
MADPRARKWGAAFSDDVYGFGAVDDDCAMACRPPRRRFNPTPGHDHPGTVCLAINTNKHLGWYPHKIAI